MIWRSLLVTIIVGSSQAWADQNDDFEKMTSAISQAKNICNITETKLKTSNSTGYLWELICDKENVIIFRFDNKNDVEVYFRHLENQLSENDFVWAGCGDLYLPSESSCNYIKR